MSIIDSILNVFLGDKGKKDVKEVTPIVNSILKIEENLWDAKLFKKRKEAGESESPALKICHAHNLEIVNKL